MTTTVQSDGFDSAGGEGLSGRTAPTGGTWTSTTSGTPAYVNAGSSTVTISADWTYSNLSAAPSANAYGETVVFRLADASSGRIILQARSAATSEYQLDVNCGFGTNTISVIRLASGTPTTLYSQAFTPSTSVDMTLILRIGMDGDANSVFASVDGSTIYSATDGSPVTQVGNAKFVGRDVIVRSWLVDEAASGPVITGPSGKQMTGGFFDLSGGTS